jgi:hypothetical protein
VSALATTPRELNTSSELVVAGQVTTLHFPEAVFSGSQWDVRRLVVADADDLFFVHCDAVVCVATPARIDFPPMALDAVDFQVGLPTPFRWSRGTIIMGVRDVLVVWVSGAVAGRRLMASCQVEEALNERLA